MRILYLAHRVPDAPTKGDKIRAFHQLRTLAARHEVHLFALDDEAPENRLDPEWKSEVASSTVVPLRPWSARCRVLKALVGGQSLSAAHFAETELRRRLNQAMRDTHFDLVIVYSGAMDPLVDGIRPRIVDLVDVDSEKFRAYHEQRTVEGWKRWVFGVEGRRLRELEQRSVAEADASILCTEKEAESLRSFARPRRLEVIGNGVDLDAFPRSSGPRPAADILFVGAMDYQANVDAASHLVNDLLPRIRARHEKAKVRIVGRNPTEEVRALSQQQGVEVHADVPSVLPFLHESTVTVLPFRVARGIQNKALEAMAAGLPVVMSEATAEGITGQAGHHYLVGNDAESLARATNQVLDSSGLQESLAHHAHQLVTEVYSWSGVNQRYEDLVGEVVQERGVA